MQGANYMQQNLAEISKMLGSGLPETIYLDDVQYDAVKVHQGRDPYGEPGLVVTYHYDNAHNDTFRCRYSIKDHPNLNVLTKAIHFEIFFMNICFNYAHLGVGECDYIKDTMRVYAQGQIVVLNDLNRFYDDEACVLHVDLFVRAVNEVLKARCDAKNHVKCSPFHHEFKPFAPWHVGDVDIKALFDVEPVKLEKVML